METVVASGASPWDLRELHTYEDRFAEGDYYLLRLRFSVPQSAQIAEQVAQLIQDQGVTEWFAVRATGSNLEIKAQKGNPFPWLLVGAALASFVAVVLLATFIGWIYIRVAEVAGLDLSLGIKIMLVGAGFLTVYALWPEGGK